jgi:hypothetical protein
MYLLITATRTIIVLTELMFIDYPLFGSAGCTDKTNYTTWSAFRSVFTARDTNKTKIHVEILPRARGSAPTLNLFRDSVLAYA